ncbi:MAG: acyl-CoA thioesterase [Crocinitomicaceae bacterium]|jgi:acyl-CoA thioester hydrolase
MKENSVIRGFSTKLRVRYSETDKMGFCYYGNYAQYFEVARVEALRELGIVYKNLEENGILLPVTEFNISYKQAAKYDDILEIKTKITKLEGTRITFQYEVFNEAHIKLNEAETTLVFVDSATMKPIPVPTFILNLVNHG